MATTTRPNKPRPADLRAGLLACIGALALYTWAALPVAAQGPPPREASGPEAPGQMTVTGRLIAPVRRRSPADRSSCCSTITADRKGPKVPAFRQG